MENIIKEAIVKVLKSSPWSVVASSTFRNKGVDIRIPFEIPAKGMKDTAEGRSKEFGFVHLEKHTKNNITDRMKEMVQKRAVI
ncbi:MAG: hypothetical protein LBQ71_15430 [Hungatella sp.]|nr:hypothetical protein [Hungatella sp.]